MRILIVGIGALGGTIAARAISSGMSVFLVTRSEESANALRRSGLRLTGIGGPALVPSINVATIQDYEKEKFDVILLATKARDALEAAPSLAKLLAPDGALVPIQNGGVSQILAEQLGPDLILGGLSNLGATMVEPGVYEQRNAGNLLIGELSGGLSARVERIASVLSEAIDVRVTANLQGAIWAKLIVNCAVTTVGAIASRTMRQYMQTSAGREIFHRMYDEALSVALAIGVQPQRLQVEPIPPGWHSESEVTDDYDTWVNEIIAFYGDLKPSMLQDLERGKRTEIDFINGYVAEVGKRVGVSVDMNAAVTDLVHQLEHGRVPPDPERLNDLLGWSAVGQQLGGR